jgi:toxin ParE1/3/4
VTKLRITAAAQDDLRDIRIYSKSVFGATIAREYMLGLRACFTRLRDRPMMGIAEKRLGSSMRSFSYKTHRIYFHSADGEVLIVRILHHARNVPSTMTPDP